MKKISLSSKLIRFRELFVSNIRPYLLGALGIFVSLIFSCQSGVDKTEEDSDTGAKKKQEVVIKKRADGTISSVNQVDEFGNVHGQRVTYYSDGKTIYSRVCYKRGKKDGLALWYNKNGKISLQLNYLNGKREGPSKRYYMSGKLMSEISYADDNPLPGLKEYDMEGKQVTKYPTLGIRENYQKGGAGIVVIELTCSLKSDKVKFYYMEEENDAINRIYLISKNGSAVKRFYLNEGQVINKSIKFQVEIPTSLGNTLVKELSYHLDARRL